jgi:hypothetical protein
MTDTKSLKRTKVTKEIGYIRCWEKMSIKDFKNRFRKLEREAKNSYENITVDFGYEDGDENNLGSSYLVVEGIRVETEKEWHDRLESIKCCNKNTLDNANRIIMASKVYMDQNDEINFALSKSSLRCEICKKPWTGMCYQSNWKKSRRICPKCSDSIRERE